MSYREVVAPGRCRLEMFDCNIQMHLKDTCYIMINVFWQA